MVGKEEMWRRLARNGKDAVDALGRIPGIEENLKNILGNKKPVFPSRSRSDVNTIVIAGGLQLEIENIRDSVEEAKGKYKSVQEAQQDWEVLIDFEDKTMFINGVKETCTLPRSLAYQLVQSKSFDGEVSDDGEALTFKHQRKVVAKIHKSLVLFLRREGREALER